MKTSDWIITGCLLIVVTGSFIGFLFWRTKKDFENDSATAHHLRKAVQSYMLEYHKAPGTSGILQSDVEFSSDLEFMKCVSGGESESAAVQNPRAIVFFYRYPGSRDRRAYMRDAELKLLANDLRDSYGKHYQIRIDANGDGKVANPTTKELIEEQVLIWSAGKDGNFETWQDNVASWNL